MKVFGLDKEPSSKGSITSLIIMLLLACGAFVIISPLGSSRTQTATTDYSLGNHLLVYNAWHGGEQSLEMSNSLYEAAYRFTSRDTNNMSSIWLPATVTPSSPPSYKVSIETDNSGVPSGTILGSGIATPEWFSNG
jgi:hypothetical protein